MEKLHVSYLESPVGLIKIVASEQYVVSVTYPRKKSDDENPNEATRTCMDQLHEYFNGSRKLFDIPVRAKGTEFQVRVWEELMKVPFGTRTTYVDLARKLGDPKYTRAVGLANSRNRISIIVPCHRVVGRDGKLTGYAGGLWRKHWLLKHESMVEGMTHQLDLFESQVTFGSVS
jgi:methylated-DNA-[protein]-cysteine S-methyltransferase